MTDYATLNDQLTGRCSRRRKVANNTYAERRAQDIAIKLHDTDVVTLHPDGSITLNTGGWYTVTTKDRLNNYLPKAPWDSGYGGWVFSNKGEWFVKWHGNTYPYRDGVRLFPDGTVTGVPSEKKLEEDRKIVAYRKKLIKEYLAAITPAKIVQAFENMGGDPWCCKMRAEDGTYPMDHGCALEHVKDKYFHASICFRAFEAAHYRDPTFWMQMIYGDAQRGVVTENLIRTLRKYLTKQLIEGRATR